MGAKSLGTSSRQDVFSLVLFRRHVAVAPVGVDSSGGVVIESGQRGDLGELRHVSDAASQLFTGTAWSNMITYPRMDTAKMPPGMERGTKIAEASVGMPTTNSTAADNRCRQLVAFHPSWASVEASQGSSADGSTAIRSSARGSWWESAILGNLSRSCRQRSRDDCRNSLDRNPSALACGEGGSGAVPAQSAPSCHASTMQ